jgi:TMEM175 potassium channel family protein
VGDYWGTGRVEAFSDGVFAIAITLLILEINVPESAFDNLWRGIAEEWPSYLAYATSFITIGGIWIVHHGIFQRLQYANRRVMLVNLGLLMAVAFLPFPTTLMAEAIHEPDATRAAVIFYGAALFVTSLLLSLLWGSVAYDRKLLMPEVDEKEVNAIALATAPTIGFYFAIILLAVVAPRVAAFGYLVVAIVAVLRAYGDRTQPSKAA